MSSSDHKSIICKAWKAGKICPFADRCMFAHGVHELQMPKQKSKQDGTNLYKTSICNTWKVQSSCNMGHKCNFAHGDHELRLRGNNFTTKQQHLPTEANLSTSSRKPVLESERQKAKVGATAGEQRRPGFSGHLPLKSTSDAQEMIKKAIAISDKDLMRKGMQSLVCHVRRAIA
ncbi:hypothetical protein CEUSTIGMA_g10164.t1 [Chlamydomonas eustigma]|uniref:C3H1-type domain-containing protein n=1 Tax=Chlamydomonas eustigma TaxID=1157962 RepID=A0A250XI38_9CHLO|nr:hypothetical protein CEUSTIGMA_g10164.t1 [Chlamydomonas eustigma]|eukprot:GAX82738.1 hypothetical protein CEUSTIGMA_g10164.t1 [Chlamydomonas eustigma]